MRKNSPRAARNLEFFLVVSLLVAFVAGIDTSHYQRLNPRGGSAVGETNETATTTGNTLSTPSTPPSGRPAAFKSFQLPKNVKNKKHCRDKYCTVLAPSQGSSNGGDVLCVCANECIRTSHSFCSSNDEDLRTDRASRRTKCKPDSVHVTNDLLRCLRRDVPAVSLDTSLELNYICAMVDDNVEIKCDVTGTPAPEIIWRRNGANLDGFNEQEIRVLNDGSIYLTRVQLMHAGNYTCHAKRYQEIAQTHVLSVYTIPEVKVAPRLQWKRPRENVTMRCHVVGVPFPRVEWLKNDRPLNREQGEKYEIIGKGTRLLLRNVEYADTGAYMCVANSLGGRTKDITSLLIHEQPMSTSPNDEPRFFTFHDWGITIHEPSACRLRHEIRARDIIPGTQEYVCGVKHAPCSWGRAITVGDRYIYVSQPNQNRVLVISNVQLVVVDVIATDKYPVELQYVEFLDQVWVQNWRSETEEGIRTIQIIRDAIQKKKHRAVHPEPIDGHTDLVEGLFIPDKKDIDYTFRYGYVTHKNQSGMYKLDLANARYTRVVDLSPHKCVPVDIQFSALYGFVILECKDPKTGRATGQLLLDYLTDTVYSHKTNLVGKPRVSPDSRQLVTLNRLVKGVTLTVQEISLHGLTFAFDVKTTLNISDIAFYPSQTTHGYDIYASSVDKEDILFLDLASGKVEIVTGVGKPLPAKLKKWGNTNRPIVQNGVFDRYMVSPAHEALFVLNGVTRTINCEIAGLIRPIAVVWTTVPLR